MPIRIPCLGDLQLIAGIEEESLSPWTIAQIAAELSYPHGIQLVAVDGAGRITGWCCARCAGPEAELLKISVRLSDRRSGIAGSLLERLEKCMTERQVEAVFLEVRSRNEAALRLYQKNGYIQVGVRPGYYSDPVDDALIFKKEVLHSNC